MRNTTKVLHKLFLIILLMCCGHFEIIAQLRIKGFVIDRENNREIVGATIQVDGSQEGTSSDKQGAFDLKPPKDATTIIIKAMGYTTFVHEISWPKDTLLTVALVPQHAFIDEVTITQKSKSRVKNPVLALIDQVIAHKKYNRLEKQDSLYYQQYDKVRFGMLDPGSGFTDRMGSMNFFFRNVDTTTFPGKEALTLHLQEQLSDNYIQQNPSKKKSIIRSQQKTEFDKRFINNHNVESYLNYIFQPIDIYDESIYFINKLFLSPIADEAKMYYKYTIRDTIIEGNDRYIRLDFTPRNKQDLLFSGELYISQDGKYAVKQVHLQVGNEVNINFVNHLKMNLSYFRHATGTMLLDTSKVTILFGRSAKDAVFGERISVNSDYKLDHYSSPDIFRGAPVEVRLDSSLALHSYRPIKLDPSEYLTYNYIDSLNNNKTFRSMLGIGYVLAQGYYPLGKVELGPLEYVYHLNDYEGRRIRLGGRTTSSFSEKIFLEGYLAYGIRDQELKYYLRTAISLHGKSVSTFPTHYMEASIQHDVFEPGVSLGYLKGDSFFRSLRANKPSKYLLTDAYRIGHLVEFGNHISIGTQLTHQRRMPVGDLHLPLSSDSSKFLKNMNTNDLQVILRWAPNEKFYYRNIVRKTIIEKYPVFNLQYNRGFKGIGGADYSYDALRFAASKRFFMNQLGFGDVTFAAGKIWGTLPYTLLEIPNVETIRDRHRVSYDLINSMEFVADQYLKFAYDHELNGYILNKIPLFKKLKWREVFGGKIFYGKLSNKNNPYISDQVIRFDTHQKGYIMTNILDERPYVEGYIGLDNIFKVLKVEYHKRLSYRELPNIAKSRFNVSLHLNF